MDSTLTGIVPSMDPTLCGPKKKPSFFSEKLASPGGFVFLLEQKSRKCANYSLVLVYGALKNGDPKNDIPDPAHRS